jgi:hypothetical protein
LEKKDKINFCLGPLELVKPLYRCILLFLPWNGNNKSPPNFTRPKNSPCCERQTILGGGSTPQRKRIPDVHHHREADNLGRTVEISERILHLLKLPTAIAQLKKFCSDKAVAGR